MIFDLDEKDLEIVSAALSRLPYFQVAELIEKIKFQFQHPPKPSAPTDSVFQD